jgi:NTE family protein
MRFAKALPAAPSRAAHRTPARAGVRGWMIALAFAALVGGGVAPPALAQAPSRDSPAAAAPAGAGADATRTRPKIGLVLSGGGARGLTHIGVLKVLEELRVPVDFITATSMGSIVGGLYASGMTAAEEEILVRSLDWSLMFSDQPPRDDLTFRRKEEEAVYTIPLELGFRDFSLRLSTGALTGQNLELLLHRLTVRDDEIGSFDRLPIPFRAVSTNMIDGTPVVFDRGPLYVAMRASMSIPGVFAPLERGGEMLGDGGLVKNLPVDIAKAMGADVVIAVNIGTPLMTRDQLSSFLGLAEQSINILTEQNVRAQLALLGPRDVLIAPDLGTLTSLDFTEGPRFIEIGEKAARAVADSLRRYSLPPETYAAYRATLRRPPAAVEPEVTFVAVTGTIRTNPEALAAEVAVQPGSPVTIDQAQQDIRELYGRGDFDRIDYRLIEERGRPGIEYVVSEKAWGPNFLTFGAGFATDVQGDNSFVARIRHKRTWLNALGGQWVNEVAIGTVTGYATEFHQPLALNQAPFVSAYGEFNGAPLDIFYEGAKVAEYNVRTDRVGLDLGYTFGTWGEVRLGGQAAHYRASPTISLPASPVSNIDEWGYALLARVDTLDNPFFPRRGVRGAGSVFHGRQDDGTASYDVTRGRLDVGAAFPIGERGALSLALRLAGTSIAEALAVNGYQLGGFLRLSGLRTNELIGPYLGHTDAVFLYRLGSLPVIGNTYYAGASAEIGNVWASRDAISLADTYKAGSVFLAADTPFGPFYVAWGHASRGASSFYLFLGRP